MEQGNQGGKGLAIASMVIGIISLLISCCYGGFLGVIALILGIISLATRRNGKGMAIAGVITSVIAIIITVVAIAFGVSLLDELSKHGVDENDVKKAQELTVDDFKSQCDNISYSELMRTPDDYKGKYVKLEVQVAQVMGENYVVRTKEKDDTKEYGYFGDQYSTYDNRVEKSPNVIEDDFMTIYGIYGGTESVTTKDVPIVNIIYLELDK